MKIIFSIAFYYYLIVNESENIKHKGLNKQN